VAVSQDGDLALIGYEQNHIVLWDLKSLKMQQSYRSDNWTTEAVNLTSDRRFAVTGGNDVGVELFELATGRHCASTGPVHRAWTVALSPDGRFALSAGGSIWNGTNFEPNGDYGIRLWQLPQVSMVSAASDEMRQTLTVFITEGKQELNDEKLQSLLARHAPVLSEFDLAVSRALASMLIELPDAAHAKLLQEGYLRWSFKSLDVKRQASLETFMKQLLAQATELGFPPATAEMGPTLLEHADVGFAIASPPDSDGQILYWYLSPHHSRMPICFPVLLANVDPNEHEILGGRWLIEKVFRISEKPYSDALPSATE
jgi:WD40 repeat protein